MNNKVEIKVCVGSSCHVRGADKTLRGLQEIIDRSGLADRIDLRADLCLEKCLEAPNVSVNGEIHGGVTPERVEEFFESDVRPLLR